MDAPVYAVRRRLHTTHSLYERQCLKAPSHDRTSLWNKRLSGAPSRKRKKGNEKSFKARHNFARRAASLGVSSLSGGVERQQNTPENQADCIAQPMVQVSRELNVSQLVIDNLGRLSI